MTDAAFDRFMMTTVGNDVTVGFGSGGVPVATSSAYLGRPGAGATATTSATGGLDISRPVPVKTGTNVSDLSAKVPISKSGMAKAFKAAAALGGGALGLAFFALPEILDWMTAAGVRRNDANDGFEVKDPTYCTVAPCYEYQGGNNGVWYSTLLQAAQNSVGQKNGCTGYSVYPHHVGTVTAPNSYTFHWAYCNDSYVWPDADGTGTVSTRSVAPSAVHWLPASMNDIADYMDKPTMAPEYAKALDNAGVKVEPDTGVKPQVTGPAKLPVSDKTTTKTDSTGTTTERTICEKEMTYANDKATMVEKCTTTTTKTKPDGTTETSTSEETEAKNAEKPDLDLCEKNPDILACQKLEKQEETPLPKADKNVTYTPETWFGGGSCPADKFVTVRGQQIKVWDWVESCNYLVTYGRPIILAAAAFMALMILAPGVKE